MSNSFYEPPVDPMHDTHPTQTLRQVNLNQPSMAARIIGLLSLLGAFVFTAGTVFLLMAPSGDGEPDPTPTQDQTIVQATTQTPTEIAPTDAPVQQPTENTVQSLAALPTVSSETVNALLQAPLAAKDTGVTMRVSREILNPFTIIPDRPRNEIITYTAESGDTIDAIATRFGLESESIAWSNDRRIVQVLRPGDVLNIPPVNGVYITAIGSTRTIADYATLYKVDDPFIIIDSEFNPLLRGYTPDTVPTSGTPIFIPGGQGEEIDWAANISVTEGGDGSGGGRAGASYVSFQPGDPGDCGGQEITGGSFWVNPVPSGGYQISRGFSGYHTGIDLAASVGVPIAAANGGRVIFAGWNSYGYGYTVALIHGPNMTVYGHLSQVNVGCGQDVSAGQIIGQMGSSGNSSGPHLHFEIRARNGNTYSAIDPSAYVGF